MVDLAPHKLGGADYPLFGKDIESLTNSDVARMQHNFLVLYSENNQFWMEAKSTRSQRFCDDHGLRACPTHLLSIYQYVHFLHDKGQILCNPSCNI